MTKQEKRNTIDSFKAVKVLITNCDLDPYYKGELLRLINKVILNKKSHFSQSEVNVNFADLFSWNSNKKDGYNNNIDWSCIGLYLSSNTTKYFRDNTISTIDVIKFKPVNETTNL